MARHAQVQYKIVHDLLRIGLGQDAGLEVALKVDVEEGRGAAEAHRRAVLLLDAGEVAEVQPLHGFPGVFRRAGDVKAIGRGHLDHVLQRLDLVGQFLGRADFRFRGRDRAERVLVLLLLFDQAVHAIQRDAAVVADDAAAAVGVRQAGQQADVARLAHVLGIGGEHAVVMRLVVFELLLDLGGDLVAVGLARLAHHAHAAERVAGAL